VCVCVCAFIYYDISFMSVCVRVCVCVGVGVGVGVTIYTFDDGSAVQECVFLRAQRASYRHTAAAKETYYRGKRDLL